MVRLQLIREQLPREKRTKRLRPHQRNKRKTEKVVNLFNDIHVHVIILYIPGMEYQPRQYVHVHAW